MLTHFGSQAVATSDGDLIFMLLVKAALPDWPRACIPLGQRASGMKRKDNLRAVMGHADWRVRQSLGLSFSEELQKTVCPVSISRLWCTHRLADKGSAFTNIF